jgi:hypothetical protein
MVSFGLHKEENYGSNPEIYESTKQGVIVFATLLVCLFKALNQPTPAKYYFLAFGGAI